MSRLAFLLLVVATAWLSTPARAATPPALPLPPCVEGQGACPKLNPLVTGTAPGTLTAGSSLLMATVATGPVCNSMDGYAYIWVPNACFAAVHTPVIVTCAYIDLRDMKFKEASCQSALYRVAAEAPAPLWTLKRPAGNTDYNGSTECGAAGNYQTYVYGGPSGTPESTWVNRGDRARFCELTMGNKRPDGLYGPTWAKVRVGIAYGENGIGRSGRSETAEFYIPIDGDLRPGVDLDVTGTATITDADWQAGKVTATYRATIWNKGTVTAENVKVTFELPVEMKYDGEKNATPCTPTEATAHPTKRGGTVVCTGFTVGANAIRHLDVPVRILNATDLNARQQSLLPDMHGAAGVEIVASADTETNTSNNKWVIALQIPFRDGSWSNTLQLMAQLNNEFNYEGARRALGCNEYKEDIFKQLEAVRARNPAAFTNLSYGPVSSGTYYIGGVFKAGHVGVVVYEKGTDYRKTGIVFNGTPFPSPLSGSSYVGSNGTSYGASRSGFTALDGRLLRTPVIHFPLPPFEESWGGNHPYGFEGRYGYNNAEFGGQVSLWDEIRDTTTSDNSVTVSTQSPVEILVTNSRGQRVETRDGQIIRQELDGRIWSFASPHEDGTFAWTIALPPDRYDVKLRGIASGSYRVTLATYKNGVATEAVADGITAPEQVNTYAVEAAPATPEDKDKGGGGALDQWVLLALGGLLALRAGWAATGRRTTPAARAMRGG
jgi:hypothetical protein